MLLEFDWFGLPLESVSEDCSNLSKKSACLPKCQHYYATQLRHESRGQLSVMCTCASACVCACVRVCPQVCVYTYVSYVFLRSRPSAACNPSPSLDPLPSACVPSPGDPPSHPLLTSCQPCLPPCLLSLPGSQQTSSYVR